MAAHPTHPALEMGLCGNAESEELPETDRPFVLHTYSLLAALPRQPVKEEEERDMEQENALLSPDSTPRQPKEEPGFKRKMFLAQISPVPK